MRSATASGQSASGWITGAHPASRPRPVWAALGREAATIRRSRTSIQKGVPSSVSISTTPERRPWSIH